ncbi:MAG: hypothetical protein AMJ43_00820 [Coxiella sp. DG_40]|nr:MAG: hypothetical protein AMJ43_00820 [Coxiella sp. DG_40]
MNIFVLDKNIKKCARYHCDKHVVKMILEYAQILCTICNQHGLKTPYKSTHIKHPCVKWAGESLQNWLWLKELTVALNGEYKYRYDTQRNHEAYRVVTLLKTPVLPNIGLTEFAQAMPQKYKVKNNAVLAYRKFYVGMKKSFATWKKRRVPKWYKLMLRGNKTNP